jgi:ATP-dependent protease HslVU (ClpYQ) peptidase subunit
MTTIVAVQHPDKVVFGADSQVTAGNGRVASHPKMVKISERGEYIIAGSGLASFCDVAQHIWMPPVPTEKDKKDLYHFMIAKVVPSLKIAFKDNECKWDAEDDETKFAFLISIGGEVFELSDDFSISLDAKGFYGVGSGSSYAIGALAAGAKIQMALKIAADNDAYTSAPFIYYTQHKKKVASKSKP